MAGSEGIDSIHVDGSMSVTACFDLADEIRYGRVTGPSSLDSRAHVLQTVPRM